MKNTIAMMALGTFLVSGAFAATMDNTSQSGQLSDAQVSKIVTTTNDGEILLAQYVVRNTKNARVKAFAQHMIDDHTLNNTLNRKVASTENIQAEESPKSEELVQKEQMTQKKLMSLKGSELDRAYMDDQIKTHEMVLNALNTDLLAATKDPALKSHILKTAKKVQEHLDMAKDVRATL
jgi:putative membrane protein